ncbi:MAG: phage tail protein I [Pseudomonadota bacterium]
MSGLLPPNRTPLERRVAASHPLALPVELRRLWDPATCPAHLLPFLAWAFSVDQWSSDWPERVKRDVIAASAKVHRIKGTRLAVDRALEAMGVEVQITEWFEAEPHLPRGTFEAVLYVNDNLTPNEPVFLSQRLYDELRAAIDAAKNVRSHYSFQVGAKFGPNRLGAGSAMSGQSLARHHARPTYRPLAASQRLGLAAAATPGAVSRRGAEAMPRVPPLSAGVGLAAAQRAVALTRLEAGARLTPAMAPSHLFAAATCRAVALTHRTMEAPA